MINRVCSDVVLAETGLYRARYRRGKLYIDDMKNGHVIISYPLYDGSINSILSKLRLAERLLRLRPRLCYGLSEDHFLFSCKGKLFSADCKSREVNIDTYFPKGTYNPLALCFSDDGTVFYGEYSWNTHRDEVGIYCRADGKWEKYCEFPKHSVCHIHNILNDPIRNCLWVFTGDSDRESGIWNIDKSTRIVKPFLVGKQTYRACYGFVTETDIVYATDTPLQDNAIYKVNIDTKSISKLYDMPGPCIYGREYEEKGKKYRCFATSVEPDASLKGMRYRLTYKLGKGVRDRHSHIIMISDDGQCKELFAGKKDILPMWLFQFGNIQFTDAAMKDGKIKITPTALKNMDGSTFELAIMAGG